MWSTEVFYAKLSNKLAGERDEHYGLVWEYYDLGLGERYSHFDSINLCIRGSRAVANNEKIIIRSLSESIKTTPTKYTPTASIDAGRSESDIVRHLCVFTLQKIDISRINQNISN